MGNAFGQCFGLNVIDKHELSTNEITTPMATNDGTSCTSRELVDDLSTQPNDLLSNETMTCCIHHNWSWVVTEALQHIISCNDRRQIVKRQSELPSQREKNKEQREKPCYALFKLEMERSPTFRVRVWVSSPCMGFLDAKDRLCRELHQVSKQSLMPTTSFIPWDVVSVDDIPDFPTHPALLKAALGSGGYGLYFVHTKQHALSIAMAHAQRAGQFDGFLEGLRRDHDGDVPAWSLQSVVNAYRVNLIDVLGSRHQQQPPQHPPPQRQRCQIRAYVVVCEKGSRIACFQYNELEVRVPSWDVDLDETLSCCVQNATPSPPSVAVIPSPPLPPTTTSTPTTLQAAINTTAANSELGRMFTSGATLTVAEFEEYCCSLETFDEGGNDADKGPTNQSSRPYNKDRNKGHTERFMLEEIPELMMTKSMIASVVKEAMVSLRPAIVQHSFSNNSHNDNNHSNNDNNHINNNNNNTSNGQVHPVLSKPLAPGPGLVSVPGLASERTHMAIAGLDLLVNDTNDQAYLIEINNNPAMPQMHKNMSHMYRNHLVTMVTNIIKLGIMFDAQEENEKQHFPCSSSLGFTQLW